MNFNTIKDRYLKNYITDAQLIRFKNLGIITEDQYNELYEMKYPKVEEEIPEDTEVTEE